MIVFRINDQLLLGQHAERLHHHIQQVSVKYQQNEKHFNYTTPKSFLEFMKLYGNLLRKKHTELAQKMERLENGLQKLLTTASQVREVHISASCDFLSAVTAESFFCPLCSGGRSESQTGSARGGTLAEECRHRGSSG